MLRIALLFLLSLVTSWGMAADNGREWPKIVLSVHGPHNLSYLPIDLIPRLGIDHQEGVELRLKSVNSGAIALKNLTSRNSDFAMAGLPAIISLKASSGDVAALASLTNRSVFVLMVRADLAGQVQRLADLRGRLIGVYASSLSSKTVSQQLAELLLRSDGVGREEGRFVPAGHTYEEMSAQFDSGGVDAMMGMEPFATRLKEAGKVFFLANIAEPTTAQRLPGADFIHVALATRGDVLTDEPDKVRRMTAMIRRVLDWIAHHTPEELVERLDIADPEHRQQLIASLKNYPGIYSPDGRFSRRQVLETQRFYQFAADLDEATARAHTQAVIDDRWLGHKE